MESIIHLIGVVSSFVGIAICLIAAFMAARAHVNYVSLANAKKVVLAKDARTSRNMFWLVSVAGAGAVVIIYFVQV